MPFFPDPDKTLLLLRKLEGLLAHPHPGHTWYEMMDSAARELREHLACRLAAPSPMEGAD